MRETRERKDGRVGGRGERGREREVERDVCRKGKVERFDAYLV